VGHRSASDSSQQVVLRRAKRISDVRCAKRLSSLTVKYRIIQVVQSSTGSNESRQVRVQLPPPIHRSHPHQLLPTTPAKLLTPVSISWLGTPRCEQAKASETDFVASTSLRYKKSQQRIYLYTPRSHCQDKAQPKRIHHEDPLRIIAPPCRFTSDDVVGFRFRFKDRRLFLA
jgi:hypothetical protein